MKRITLLIIIIIEGLSLANSQIIQSDISFHFQHLSLKEGLPQTSVYSLIQDKLGYIWVATADGIARYDGYQFKLYRQSVLAGAGLGNNRVTVLLEDQKGNIWIATDKGGLSCWYKEIDKIVPVSYEKTEADLSSAFCHAMTWGKDSVLWIGANEGLFYLDPMVGKLKKMEEFKVFSLLTSPDGTIWVGTNKGLNRIPRQSSSNYSIETVTPFNEPFKGQISSLAWGQNEQLWIGTTSGLYLFDWQINENRAFEKIPKLPVKAILCDSTQTWVAGEMGLCRISTSSDTITIYPFQQCNPNGLGNTSFETLLLDAEGLLWIGTYDGIRIWNPFLPQFFNPFEVPCQRPSLKRIRAIWEDSTGNLWVGGEDLNLYKISKDYQIHSFPLDSKQQILAIYDIWAAAPDEIWLATNRGILPFDLKSERFRYSELDNGAFVELNTPLNNPGNDYTDVFDLEEDARGLLWIATIKKGLFIWDPKSKKMYHPSITKQFEIRAIHVDLKGNTWLLSQNHGAYLAEPQLDSNIDVNIRSISELYTEAKPLLGKDINYMYSTDTTFWLGTQVDGLFRLDLSNHLTSFKEPNFPNNTVYAIAIDSIGKLWISSNIGLITIDPHKPKEWKLFDVHDGLPSNEFNWGEFYKTQDGRFIFGSVEGLVIFRPEAITKKQTNLKIAMTGFQINGKNPKTYTLELPEQILSNSNFSLRHDLNSLTFTVSALSYAAPNKYTYRFTLINKRDTVLDIQSIKRDLSLFRLPPGGYSLYILAYDSQGKAGEPFHIFFTLKSPPFSSPFAMICYILIGIFIIGLFIRARYRQRHLKKIASLERQEKEKLKEIDQAKDRFISNIFHIFRTPLTLVLGGLEKLTPRTDPTVLEEYVNIMRRNAEKLRKMINRILLFSKMESSQEPLRLRCLDIGEFLHRLVGEFQVYIDQQDASLKFNNLLGEKNLVFDPEQLEDVVSELIVNAIKYRKMDEKCQIELILSKHQEEENAYIAIHIKDNGIGITPQAQAKIFNRFYQEDESLTRQAGLGLGLAIADETIKRHGGRIEINSILGVGTTFTLMIPQDLKATQIDKPYGRFNKESGPRPNHIIETEPSADDVESGDVSPEKGVLILVIDDDPDMRKYICDVLKENYHVHLAKNGKEGLNLALQHIPDLIISDVMMPEMDGLTFAKELKKNDKTNHIPLILLTVNVEERTEIESYRYLVDTYLTKPVSQELIRSRVNSLLEIRQNLQAAQHKMLALSVKGRKIFESQNPFIKDLLLDIEGKINLNGKSGNYSFGVDELASEVLMERTSLYRKIKAILGISPQEFLNVVKMEKAASLLIETDDTIDAIAFQVGHRSESTFSKAFIKYSGKSPNDFRSDYW